MSPAATVHSPGIDSVRLEMSASTLARLLAGGHVGAADLRCQDCASRQSLRRLCLRSCIGSRASKDSGVRCGCPGTQGGGRVENRS
jgi:hypothetical protein